MDLWLELLRFRKRLDGSHGVVQVWIGMRQRNVRLPVQGPVADALWSNLLTLGFAGHPEILEQLYVHAVHLRDIHGLQRPTLYQNLVGGYLRHFPLRAVKWHQRLTDDCFTPSNPAAALVGHVNHSNDRKRAWNSFKRIYTMSQASGLYDLCMPSICEQCDIDVALMWHRFLLSHDDLPSSVLRTSPTIDRLFEYARLRKPGSYFVNAPAEAEAPAQNRHRLSEKEVPLISRQNMSTLVGDVHGIRQRKIGDAFCARLFATNAFSIDLVISGLRLLGLEVIGSLALREIGARAQSLHEYINAIGAIESAGIAVEQTIFSRALRKFAEEGEDQYFQILVQSDRHPDTYGNSSLQRRLFSSFLDAGSMAEAYTTLAVLTIDRDNPDHFSWNLLFGVYAERNDRPHALQALQEMQRRGIPVSDRSLDRFFHSVLRPRASSKKPTTESYVEKVTHPHDLDLVTNVFLTLLKSGQYIQPERWRDILRRYGMTNRIQSLESLSLWLASCYSQRVQNIQARSPAELSILQPPEMNPPDVQHLPTYLDPAHPSHPFSVMFSVPLLRAVIAWGFRSAVPPFRRENELYHPSFSLHDARPHLGTQTWARGIRLIRNLRDRYGLRITHYVHREIRREVRTRLWILFGPDRSSVKSNRVARDLNKKSLCHYVQVIQKVWGDENYPLLDVPQDLLEQGRAADARLYVIIFGSRRRGVGKTVRSSFAIDRSSSGDRVEQAFEDHTLEQDEELVSVTDTDDINNIEYEHIRSQSR